MGQQRGLFLLHDGALFGQAFTDGIETIAGWMARDLEAFASQTELEESDRDPPSCFQE